MSNKWEYKENFHTNMDGDYDGHYEVTNGKISLCTANDPEDITETENTLQAVVKALNNTGCEFYTNNPLEINQYCEIEQMKDILAEAKLQIGYLHNKFKETGSGNNVLSRIETALTPKTIR